MRSYRQARTGHLQPARGASTVEYALALALVGLVFIAGIGRLEEGSGSELSDRGQTVGNPDGFVPVSAIYAATTAAPPVVTTTAAPPPTPTTLVPPTVVTVAPTTTAPATTAPPASTTPPTTLLQGTGPGIHIESLSTSAIEAKNKKTWSGTVVIEILDNNGDPAQNATVVGSWSAGTNSTTTCQTDSQGFCSMTQWNMEARASRPGVVTETTLTINDVASSSNKYQPTQNLADSITIVQP